jgi:excisionase family DNA binding protein
MDLEPWIDSKTAGEHLGVPSDWLVSNIKKLEIPHTKLCRQYRFKRSELDSWARNKSCLESV